MLLQGLGTDDTTLCTAVIYIYAVTYKGTYKAHIRTIRTHIRHMKGRRMMLQGLQGLGADDTKLCTAVLCIYAVTCHIQGHI